MTLTGQIAFGFSNKVRKKGQGYFQKGAVELVEGDRDSVFAYVQGESLYEVFLERKKSTIHAWCSCPYFEQHFDPCKHIWATLLVAEGRDYLLGAKKTAPQYVEPMEKPALLSGDEDADDTNLEDDPMVGDPYEDDDDTSFMRKEWRDEPAAFPFHPPAVRPPAKRAKERHKNWKKDLQSLTRAAQPNLGVPGFFSYQPWPAGRELAYVLDVPASQREQSLVIQIAHRSHKRNGDWSKLKFEPVRRDQIDSLPDQADRQVLTLLLGASASGYDHPFAYWPRSTQYAMSGALAQILLPMLGATGRFLVRKTLEKDDVSPLRWDAGTPWEFRLKVARVDKKYLLEGYLGRGDEQMPLDRPVLVSPAGVLIEGDRITFLNDHGAFELLSHLQLCGPMAVPEKHNDELIETLVQFPRLPPLDLPDELRFEEVAITPRPKLKVSPPPKGLQYGKPKLKGELSFDYEGQAIGHDHPGRGIYQKDRRRFLLRHHSAEQQALARLNQLGFRRRAYSSTGHLELAPRNLPSVVKHLLAEGWEVEAEGKLYRKAGPFHIEVRSGIDWFELHGSVEFGDTRASLPELLTALRRGEKTVRLNDGTFGILPEDWLKRYGLLAGLGQANKDHLRFVRSQVGLLDALLASQPEANCDKAFAQARRELQRFAGIEPASPPQSFQGELRGYQRDGLGWLHFLRRFTFGGCLADDMGLGKTVQVLALLESRRLLRADKSGRNAERPAPSLVVVPRSLVFNWKQEAARFTPGLRVLDHTGIGRSPDGSDFDNHDVILTTYGTLRRDILLLKDRTFDYCILDEAQAIKNASSESAKAARLIQSRQRLALSGTPVENHLGELWSLFEFLNPGMLGSSSVFRLGGAAARNPDPDTRALLAQALRPFILRRTKDQVATELPEKLEQTLYCELEGEQRRRYDELREHYRRELLARIDRDGLNRSKIQVLEALLRLRQAACHPGLIDKFRVDEPSAKLDLLLPQLAEVLDEGHKVLVFSQFTSLLAIVRDRLEKEAIAYEYLDGKTRDRASRVERFQTDPGCKLFLISLKAGGLGLNLTAAEYVFLLDPWWNPAVEAQAIDRTHRIGQSRRVFAYRIIARDTVEEKVLELQQSKRALADAIINADNSLIRDLGRKELELLLS
jgi:superfamily II DNA or RNA helicase